MLIFLILVAITPVVASDNSYPQEAVQNKANTEETPGITPATELIWKSEIVNPSGNPVIYKDLIIIGNRSGWLTAVNRKTGKRVWTSGETSLELNTRTTPLIYQDRVVYLHGNTDNHAIFEVRWASNGTLDRSWDTGLVCNQAVESSPVLIDDRLGTFVWGTGNEDTQCDISGGRIRVVSFWRDGKRDQDVHTLFNTKGTVSSTPTFADGHLFFGDDAGRVYSIIPHYYTSIDSQEGSKNQSLASEVWEAWIGTRVISSPAVSDNFVYVTSWGEPFTLYALDERTGDVNWKYEHYTFAVGSPVINKNIIYVVDEDGEQLSAFNTRDGTPVWSRALKSSISYGFPTITNDILYVGTNNGDLVILDPASGNIIGGYRASGSIQSTAVIDDNVIFFTTADGYLNAVEQQNLIIDWQRSFGGSRYDSAEFIFRTNTGHIFAVGETESSDGDINGTGFHGVNDIIVAYLDPSGGDTIWKHAYGGGNGISSVRQVLELQDSLLLIGYTQATNGDFNETGHHGHMGTDDIFLMKVNKSTGQLISSKCYGGSGNDIALWGALSSDESSIVLTGYTNSNDGDFSGLNKGIDDIFAIKINLTTNEVVSAKCYGGSNHDQGTHIEKAPDSSGYYIAGYTASNDKDYNNRNHGGNSGTSDAVLFFIDNDLNLIPEKFWIFGGPSDEDLWGLMITRDNNITLIGNTNSNSGEGDIPTDKHGPPGTDDIWFMKINSSNGTILDNRCYGGTNGDYGVSIREVPQGGYFLLGSTKSSDGDVTYNHGGNSGTSDLWLLKTDLSGNIEYQQTFGGTGNDYGKRFGVQHTSQYIPYGCIIGTSDSSDGQVSGNHGLDDIWIINLRAPTSDSLW